MPNLISFQITDAGGRQRNFTVPVNDDATLTEIQAFVVQIGNELDNITGGRLTRATVNYQLDISSVTVKASALADVPIWVSGRYGFDAAGTNYRSSLVVPALNPAAANDEDVIDDAVAPNTAFTIALLSGINCTVQDKYGNALTTFLSGKRVSRK